MKNSKILYIIDMVKGFVSEGIMHDSYIAHTISKQIELINKFQKENEIIAFVKEAHSENCVEFETFPKHCVTGTSEAELVDELQEYENQALVYLKNSTSAL